VISFVKELDKPTAKYVRQLSENQPRIAKKFPRRIRIIVVWLDGDKKLFANWAAQNKIENVQLAVAAQDAANLAPWKLRLDCSHTAVLLNRKLTLASYGDPNEPSVARLESSMDKHFKPR
jgi:hypothetical protein